METNGLSDEPLSVGQGVLFGLAAADCAPLRVMLAIADNRIAADAHDGRSDGVDRVEAFGHHEVSHQNGDLRGGDGNVARVIIVPPQHGQR
jgi:hypothetical protein